MSADPLRSAHGNGANALLRCESLPLDEISPPNAADTEHGIEVRNARGRPFQRGNKAAKNKRPVLCSLGVPIATSDPRYRSALRKSKAWMKRRQRELAVQHGGDLGAGPSAMLANAALALAASRVLYELASESLDPQMFAMAARLGDSARQQELTAVGLAMRDAEARSRLRSSGSLSPIVDEIKAEAAARRAAMKEPNHE